MKGKQWIARAVINRRGKVIEVNGVLVKQSIRRKGYGTRLLRTIENEYCGDVDRIKLESDPYAVDFWLKNGFRVYRYNENGTVTMSKPLKKCR